MQEFPTGFETPYIDFDCVSNHVCLDGYFNKEQLKFLVDNFEALTEIKAGYKTFDSPIDIK